MTDPLVRLAGLLDQGSLTVVHGGGATGTTVALGRVHGVDAIAFCMDAFAAGADECRHVADAIDFAVREGRTVIGLWRSGGAGHAGGIEAMDGIGRIFAATVRASGTIPQISVVLGPVAGAAAYGPALTDVVIMAPAGRLSVTRRDAARGVTGGQIGMEGSGEPETHDREPGVAHIVAGSREDACVRARRVASLLAVPGKADPDAAAPAEDLRALLPASPRRPYDVRPLVTGLLDHDDDGFSFEEFQATWAPNVVIGLGRLGGQTVGVVANNLAHKGGRLDLPSAEKAARFVRLCDCMGVPLLSLIDASGHLPGLGREWSDVVRHGAKLLYAFVEASVPPGLGRHPAAQRQRLHRPELALPGRYHGVRLAGYRVRPAGYRVRPAGRRHGGDGRRTGRARPRPSAARPRGDRRGHRSVTDSGRRGGGVRRRALPAWSAREHPAVSPGTW
ncbi:carboxyl transferase domain-containing protein [Actinomadura madurae]|uniref:carboxyl transferase domain-containing protein n=1 Tax=Actinomadura madurae TaxID=1993 RepID=UPI0020D2403C|nr:hypothetical protein [Actinomadura madurae]